MDRRKEELEKKRLKLAELRRAREERQQALLVSQNRDREGVKDRRDIDDLVASLVGDRASQHSPTGLSSPEPTDVTPEAGGSASPTATVATSPTQAFTPNVNQPRFIPEFTSVETVIWDLPPKERVIYNKEVQTTECSFDKPEVSEEEIRERLQAEREKEEKAKMAALEEERAKQQKEAEIASIVRELSDDEKKAIVSSNEFMDFVDQSSKIIERALNEKYDFMVDYTLGHDADGDDSSGNRVKFLCSFYDDKWSKSRSITDVAWSPKYPELLATSYNKNMTSVNEPDGVVLVWNLHLMDRPEFVFHTQSDVMKTMFSPFHPNLIIGGTYSGQIVLWDTRAKSLPVLKTPLSAVGHTHPVYSMTMVGTQNAHNLISASTDGTVCSWQLDMLAQPQETLELLHPSHNKTDEISVTTVGFPDNETTAFWVGTEEGNVYQANRYDRAGSKAGINQFDTYKGHNGVITGLHFHPLVGPIDFSDLFLTCSVDWTVKLWKAKSVTKAPTAPRQISPLYSFEEASDYVYDVKWSPSHPSVFAAVDASGHFDLWNLNSDTEVPTVRTVVGSGRGLNKIEWDKEGRKAAIGSSDGHLYVYDIGDMAVPRPDEWNIFQKTVSEMTATSPQTDGSKSVVGR
ncbi:WD40 repeat-like protein [Basidiobolus meristosporus CBS 931.73]|uniref:WD40 repeat-like protein n=1 Tax=Basidiobolus meristosporus CBS 931.73 TaxID=1314790 RepID=A0A1Y1Y9T0_9FUNG|nr:WD40 repeat-like protein [Basidiobolus meristosporus CBS 931.73]|eukprot:ORX94506.1 WD40 repeat-like protein [Basidiobolus meristosporus CBS 931.73]